LPYDFAERLNITSHLRTEKTATLGAGGQKFKAMGCSQTVWAQVFDPDQVGASQEASSDAFIGPRMALDLLFTAKPSFVGRGRKRTQPMPCLGQDFLDHFSVQVGANTGLPVVELTWPSAPRQPP
jgi:hypothetical protein